MSVEHKLVPNNGIYPFVTQYSYDSFNVAIGRKMKDGHFEENISKRQLLWDDENRLLTINDNGYVSTYRYDDAGNRTVKLLK